jgi:hypothetical protein
VQILEDEQQWSLLREPRQELREIPEETRLELTPLLARAPNGGFARREQREEMRQLGHGPAREHRESARVQRAKQRYQRVGEQGVGHPDFDRVGASDRDQPSAFGGALRGREREPRFALAALPLEKERGAPPLFRRVE